MSSGAVFSLPPPWALSLSSSRCQGNATRALHVLRLARSPSWRSPAGRGQVKLQRPAPTRSRCEGAGSEGGERPGAPAAAAGAGRSRRALPEPGPAAGRSGPGSRRSPLGASVGASGAADPAAGRAGAEPGVPGPRPGCRDSDRDTWIQTGLPPPSCPSAPTCGW